MDNHVAIPKQVTPSTSDSVQPPSSLDKSMEKESKKINKYAYKPSASFPNRLRQKKITA